MLGCDGVVCLECRGVVFIIAVRFRKECEVEWIIERFRKSCASENGNLDLEVKLIWFGGGYLVVFERVDNFIYIVLENKVINFFMRLI